MRRPALPAVAVALLVATAGCSGFGSQSPADETTLAETTATERTETEETTRNEATTTEKPTDAELPPGLTESGVETPSALAGAHRERLADRSLTLDNLRVERYENGTVEYRTNQTIRAAANRTRYRVVANVSSPNWLDGGRGDGELWANGTHVFRANTANGTTNYSTIHDADSTPADPRDRLRSDLTLGDRLLVLFTAFEGERVERVSRNATGPVRYRVTATDLAHPDLLGDGAEARNGSLVAVVEEGGPASEAFVRNYTVRYETTVEGETLRVTERVRFSNVGTTTVERPEWYAGATNRTA